MKKESVIFKIFLSIKSFLSGRKKAAILLLAVSAAGIVYQSAVYFINRETVAVQKQEAVNIETYKIKISDHDVKLQTSGAVLYRDKATIASKITGRAVKIFVRAGDRVSRGQLLAKIETGMIELDLKSARAELQSAETMYRLSSEKVKKAEKNVEKEMKNIARAKADYRDKYAGLKNIENMYRKKQELFRAGGVADAELDSFKT